MVTTKPTARDLRVANRAGVLRALYFGGDASRLELSQITSLSTATVTNVVAELLADGLVREAGSEESQGGRPRTMLTIAADAGYFIGIDLGENVIRIELFDLLLHPIVAQQVVDVDNLHQPQTVIERIVAGVAAVAQAAQLPLEGVIGAGIGVPGMVDHATDVTVFAPSIGWRNVPLLAELERQLPFPVFLDNGAKAMAQAEALLGAGQGVADLAAVLLGTGLGAGIITGNALFRGATNSAGEWGHMKVVLDGRQCRCGSAGCLEAYLGAHALLERWAALAAADVALNQAEEDGINHLVSAASAGDPAAQQVLDEATRYLSLGIANLINLFNPQRIILGGWAGLRLGPAILPDVRRLTREYALEPPFSAVTIDLCHFGQDAVALGAATLALEEFLTAGGKQRSLAMRTGGLVK